MADYTVDILDAHADILEAGELTSWEHQSLTLDPVKPWLEDEDDPDTPTPDIPVLFIPLNRSGYEGLFRVPDTEIPTGRKYGLMPGDVGFIPKLSDICIRSDGTRLSVLNADALDPNGQVILYAVTFQKE